MKNCYEPAITDLQEQLSEKDKMIGELTKNLFDPLSEDRRWTVNCEECEKQKENEKLKAERRISRGSIELSKEKLERIEDLILCRDRPDRDSVKIDRQLLEIVQAELAKIPKSKMEEANDFYNVFIQAIKKETSIDKDWLLQNVIHLNSKIHEVISELQEQLRNKCDWEEHNCVDCKLQDKKYQ